MKIFISLFYLSDRDFYYPSGLCTKTQKDRFQTEQLSIINYSLFIIFQKTPLK